jgi:prepilin-type processing-associated H-X9-DG protein
MSTAGQGQPVRAKTPTWLIVGIILAGVFGFCVVLAVPVALLLPAIQAAREAARRSVCTNQMKQIGIALQNYHDTYKTFPPAYLADANGKPMHSWRVLILPFLEHNDIYERYDFNEPWDGPNNRRLATALPDNPFHCPSSPDDSPTTNYAAVVGPETVWPGTEGVTRRGIVDGTSRTIMLVEVNRSGINWMEPRDLSLNEALAGINPAGSAPKISAGHVGGVNALFCDSSVHFLPNETPRATLRALLTASGGEPADLPD